MAQARRAIRILHLEDNPRDADLILRRLKEGDVTAEVVRAGARKAFEAALGGEAFDLVLCDFNVPDWDGLSALRQVRKTDRDLPVIMLSGELSEEQAVECLRAGATDYLLKHRLQRLVPAVERALREARERRRRRESERVQRESDERFRSAMQFSPIGMALVAPGGTFVDVNRALCSMLGYAREELLETDFESITHEEDVQAELVMVRETLEGKRETYQIEKRYVHRKGHAVWALLSVSLIRDAGGAPRYFIAQVMDFSERRRMEEQLRQSQKLEAVGQLSGGIAHDFNNLLGVMLGNLDLLERALESNEPALKRVRVAQKAAARGADLTRRLLAFSRRERLSAEPVAVAGCAANVLEMAGRTIGPDVAIKTRIAHPLPPVLADAAGLENVLLNLIINSRDAMPQGGSITIAARVAELDEAYPGVKAGELEAGRYVCITVTDTGDGMAPEVLRRVFEPFFTTKGRAKGTGLGLAMVYGFAKQSGGHVSIYSEPGHGTSVKLYLPPTQAEAAAADEPKAPSRENLEGTALVVDDEVDLLEVAVAYLEEMGLRVLHAMDGPGALAVLEREPGVDLLVTDIMMPGGMNGVELARRARLVRPQLRVVYSTGFSSAALSGRSGTAVDGPVLNKPYRRTEFIEAIRRAMF